MATSATEKVEVMVKKMMEKIQYGECPESLMTVYRSNFKGEPTEREKGFTYEPNYKNILTGPCEYRVLPEVYYNRLEDKSDYAKLSVYREKLLKARPYAKKHYGLPLDEKIVGDNFWSHRCSTYQLDFYKKGDKFVPKDIREKVTLPEGWGPTPETSQRRSYRDFRKLVSWNVTSKPILPSACKIKLTEKERQILNARTGISEYKAQISCLGGEITNNGQILPQGDCHQI